MDTITDVKKFYGPQLAEAALKLGAIKLRVDHPFTWASGYRMPIYNDNRQFLAVPEYRTRKTSRAPQRRASPTPPPLPTR